MCERQLFGRGVLKPPARCRKRSWGWFPRGHSCTPSCAPRSWSDLSPAEQADEGRGSRGHRQERASEKQHRGGNSQRLQFTRGQQVSEGEEQRSVSYIKTYHIMATFPTQEHMECRFPSKTLVTGFRLREDMNNFTTTANTV